MIDIDFKFYLSLFWRRFPLFLIVFLTIAAGAITVAYILPPVYRATATILSEPPQTDFGNQTPITTSPTVQLETLRKRLMTRANLLDVASRLGIFVDRPDMSPSAKIIEMQANTQFQLVPLGQLTRNSRIPPNAVSFSISYLSQNPNIAARVTSEFATILLNEDAEIRTTAVADDVRFFDEEVRRLGSALDDIERQIVLFKTENSDSMPGSLPVKMQQVAGLENQIDQIEVQAQAVRDQRDQLVRAMQDPALLATLLPGRPKTPEEQQLAALNGQLAQKIGVLSNQHPEVIRLRAEIKVLEELIAGQADPSQNSGAPTQLQVQLDQYNIQLDRIAAQQSDLRTRIAELNTQISRIPDVEMQFNILSREHEGLKAQHATAVGNRNAAERGEIMEANQRGRKLELIQQASVPEFPESPNRLLIALGGIAGGGAAGLALLVLLELLNQSVRRPAELVSGLGIQPFATIPYIATRAELLRARLRMAASLAVIVIGVPALLYTVHYQYMPLDLLLSNILERFGLGGLTASLS